MSIKSNKNRKWFGGVTGLYLILIIITPLIWFQLTGTQFFPELMVSFIYPYTYAEKGFDDSIVWPIVITQFVVISSYVTSVFIYRSKNRALNYLAGFFAILWFIGTSFVFLIAHLH